MFSSVAATNLRRTTALRIATPAIGPVRNLNVHEYISMELMNQHGIATPRGFVAKTPEEAEHIFNTMMNKRKFLFLQWVCFFATNRFCFCN
jgi:succinyl-CoA synthetase beta subunit